MERSTESKDPSAKRVGITVFATSFLAGLGVVTYPASSGVMRSLHPLTDVEWGGLFLAHMIGVIAGSMSPSRHRSFQRGLAAVATSGAVAVTLWFAPSSWAAGVLWLGAGTMGLGFGLLAGPLNALPGQLYPKRAESALIALHAVQGVGFASGPIAVAWLGGAWLVIPGTLIAAALLLSRVSVPVPVEQPEQKGVAPRALLPFVAVVLLYAIVEGTFANWAPIFLQDERGVAPATAVVSISMFWGGILVGRVLFALLVLRLGARRTWLGLPLAMALVLFLLPVAEGAWSGLALFAAAGVACSAFLPLTLAFATKRFSGRESAVASVLIASLAVGIGMGSFLLGVLRQLASFDVLYRVAALFPLLMWVLLIRQHRARASVGEGALSVARRPLPQG